MFYFIGLFFFFFKQKTAYEMSISDWSSDVCSSDLDALVEGIKSVAKSQSIDFDHIAITGLSDGASTATYALIHSRIFSLALLSSCCEDPDVLETDVGDAYISHIRKNDYPRSEEHTSELQSLMRI